MAPDLKSLRLVLQDRVTVLKLFSIIDDSQAAVTGMIAPTDPERLSSLAVAEDPSVNQWRDLRFRQVPCIQCGGDSVVLKPIRRPRFRRSSAPRRMTTRPSKMTC